MSYKIVLSGFETKDQARGFLDWFEAQGEQDDTLGEWVGDDVTAVRCDLKTPMIELPDGYEYKVTIHKVVK